MKNFASLVCLLVLFTLPTSYAAGPDEEAGQALQVSTLTNEGSPVPAPAQPANEEEQPSDPLAEPTCPRRMCKKLTSLITTQSGRTKLVCTASSITTLGLYVSKEVTGTVPVVLTVLSAVLSPLYYPTLENLARSSYRVCTGAPRTAPRAVGSTQTADQSVELASDTDTCPSTVIDINDPTDRVSLASTTTLPTPSGASRNDGRNDGRAEPSVSDLDM